jgi:hypothetical protein
MQQIIKVAVKDQAKVAEEKYFLKVKEDFDKEWKKNARNTLNPWYYDVDLKKAMEEAKKNAPKSWEARA